MNYQYIVLDTLTIIFHIILIEVNTEWTREFNIFIMWNGTYSCAIGFNFQYYAQRVAGLYWCWWPGPTCPCPTPGVQWASNGVIIFLIFHCVTFIGIFIEIMIRVSLFSAFIPPRMRRSNRVQADFPIPVGNPPLSEFQGHIVRRLVGY